MLVQISLTILVFAILFFVTMGVLGFYQKNPFRKDSKKNAITREIKQAKKRLFRKPDSRKSKLVLAEGYYYLKDWGNAFAYYSELFDNKFEPTFRNTKELDNRLHYAETALRNDKIPLAKSILAQLEQWRIVNFHYLYVSALTSYFNQEYHQALEYFMQCQTIMPEHQESSNHIGYCYFHIGKTAQAVEILENSYVNHLLDIDGKFILARALVDRGNLHRAKLLLKSFTDIDRYAFEAAKMLGEIELEHKNDSLAITYFNQALDKHQGDDDSAVHEILYRIANLYILSDAVEESVKCLKRIQQQDPYYKNIHELLEKYTHFVDKRLLNKFIVLDTGEFIEYCQKVLHEYFLPLSITSSMLASQPEYIDFKVHISKRQSGIIEHRLCRIIRSNRVTGIEDIRSLYDTMEHDSFTQVICISTGDFTPSAHEYTINRSLVLVGRRELSRLLNAVASSDER